MITETQLKQMREAVEATFQNAHSPYSNLNVGVALLTDSDKIYLGVNVENASFPEGVCAETSAISAMVTNGETRIKALMVLSDFDPAKGEITPCGGCRQRIAEFSNDATDIYIANIKNTTLTHFKMGDLLPHQFKLKE